jgi:AcrR family transcriptional regulator
MRVHDKAPMAERILATADRLFYQRGVRAVGVDTVAAEAGISKRSLYDYFPSKDALVAAYLERRCRLPAESGEPPEMQILAVFDHLGQAFRSGTFRGCAFVNAVAELGDTCQAAKGIAARYKEERRSWFRDRLERMGVSDADGLATQLAMLLDGAIVAMLVREDAGSAHAAREAARVLMAAAVHTRRPAR